MRVILPLYWRRLGWRNVDTGYEVGFEHSLRAIGEIIRRLGAAMSDVEYKVSGQRSYTMLSSTRRLSILIEISRTFGHCGAENPTTKSRRRRATK